MLRFALRRLLVMGPLVFVVLTITFVMVQIAPGSPFSSQRRLPPEIEANLKAKYGFDQPRLTQYIRYMGRLVGFTYSRETKEWTWHPWPDFGDSTKYKDKTVNQIIKEALPVSAVLGLMAYLVAAIVGVGAGILAAWKQNSWVDHVTTGVHAGRIHSQLCFGASAGDDFQPDTVLASAGSHGMGVGMGIPSYSDAADIVAAGHHAVGCLHRLYRAADPQRDGRVSEPGLYPDCPREGTARVAGRTHSCIARRHPAGCQLFRTGARVSDYWNRGGGADLCNPGPRRVFHRCGQQPGSFPYPGIDRVRSDFPDAREPARRHGLRMARSQDPV